VIVGKVIEAQKQTARLLASVREEKFNNELFMFSNQRQVGSVSGLK
jgi:hypothetical protein